MLYGETCGKELLTQRVMLVEEIYFSRVTHDGASTKIESSTFFISHRSSNAAELRQV